jgi:hypothetical protein
MDTISNNGRRSILDLTEQEIAELESIYQNILRADASQFGFAIYEGPRESNIVSRVL